MNRSYRTFALCALAAIAIALCPPPAIAASAGEGGTLDALPKPSLAYVVIHADDLDRAATRLGNSFTLAEVLGRHMERGFILDTLRNQPPVEALSLIREYDSSRFHGAVRLTDHGRELLDFLPGGPRAMEEGAQCEYRLFTQALNVKIVKVADNLFSLAFFGDSSVSFHLDFAASVDADKGMLFIGSDPEEALRAREVYESGEGRAEISRRSGRKSFIILEDTGDEDGDFSMTREFLRDVLDFRTDPDKGLSLELSWDLPDNAVRLSLRHNIADFIPGDIRMPNAAVDPDDPGLGFGGGDPWLAGALGIDLDEDSLLDLMIGVAGGEKARARAFLEAQGIDPTTAAKALRSFGFVLGGACTYRSIELNGGYVFLAGDPEGMRQCVPFLKMAVSSSLRDFEEVEREGWDFYFVPEVEEWEAELGKRFGWTNPVFVGMRDGVLLGGALDEKSLPDKPAIDWSADADGEKPVFRLSLSPGRLTRLLAGLKGPQLPAAKRTLENLSLDEDEVAELIRVLIHFQEIARLTLDVTARDSMELSIDTKDADYQNAWELLRLRDTLSAMDD